MARIRGLPIGSLWVATARVAVWTSETHMDRVSVAAPFPNRRWLVLIVGSNKPCKRLPAYQWFGVCVSDDRYLTTVVDWPLVLDQWGEATIGGYPGGSIEVKVRERIA